MPRVSDSAGLLSTGRSRSTAARERVVLSARLVIVLASAMCAPQSMAHHSGAMYDREKQITLSGTVRQFQWTSPHCWIQVIVPTEGKSSEWSIQMGSPNELFRGGWRPATLKVGDKIQLVVSPARAGTTAGMFLSGTSSTGDPLGGKFR
jgi:hypothetical protein